MIADGAGELRHDLGVADVAALRGNRHQQMVPDQPRDEIGVVPTESVPGAELPDQVRTQLGVVAVATLGDVMEETRDVDELRLGQAREDVGAVGELMVASGVGEPPQVADHEQAVLVDGVDVEQVVLHLTRHLTEDGQVGAQDSVPVHPAQLVVDAPGLAQDFQKEAAGTEIGPEPIIDPVSVCANEPDRGRAHPFQVGMLLQQEKYLEEGERIAVEDILAGHLQIAVHRLEAPVQRLDAITVSRVEDRLLEVLEEHLVQTRKLHHFTVVALHQTLHAESLRVVLEPQHLGEPPLMVEQEPVLGPPRQHMQREPHSPQEPSARLQGVEFFGGEKPAIDQLRQRHRPEMALRDPGDGLDVAQAARTLLDVRLQVVAGVVEPMMARALLRHFRLEEPPARPDVRRAGAFPHPHTQDCGPADEPAVHEIGGDGNVASRLVHAFAYRSHAAPHREPDIPQERKEAIDPLALVAAHRAAGEDEQVDVRAWMQLSPAIAADRDERATFVIIEAEAVPCERKDLVDESRPGFDQRGHRFALEESGLQARPHRGDGITNIGQGHIGVDRGEDRLGDGVGGRPVGVGRVDAHRDVRSFTSAEWSSRCIHQRARSNRARSRSQSRLRSAARLSCCFRPRAVARRTLARPRVQCMSRATRV